jgi:outer membrane lipoprotein SlyB
MRRKHDINRHAMEAILNFPKTPIIVSGILALIATVAFSGCTQKATTEASAAQVKSAMANEKTTTQATVPVSARHKKSEAHEKSAPVAQAGLARAETAAPEHRTLCADCGVVVSVKAVEQAGKGSGLGVVAGGVLGGLAGNQVGNGTGRDLATIAGVIGGAIAGNKVEEKVKKTTVYDVTVKLENGKERILHYRTLPGVAEGEKVKVENDRAVRL